MTFYERLYFIEQAHRTMISMNNEEAYDLWVYHCPDEATREDFEDIANNPDLFDDCREAFYRLYDRYKGDGLYNPLAGVLEFLEGLGYESPTVYIYDGSQGLYKMTENGYEVIS